MKVYSFNRTIYMGCVERDFYLYCLWRYPGILRYVPGQLFAMLRYWFGSINQTQFWQAFHRYLRGVPKISDMVERFWREKGLSRLSPTYLGVKQPEDVVATGVPACLLAPAQAHLGLKEVIASSMDLHSGLYMSLCCLGSEKLRRVQEAFPLAQVEEFWSGSFADEPLAQEAHMRYFVQRGKPLDWDGCLQKQSSTRRWMRTWISPEFFRFWCVGCVNMIVAWGLEVLWSFVLPPNLGFAVGYAMSLLVSFVLNSKITFQAPLTFYRLGRFVLSYIPNFLVQNLSVLLFYNLLGLPNMLTYYLAALVGTPVTFVCLKFFAFREK